MAGESQRPSHAPETAAGVRTFVDRAERLEVLFPLLFTLEDGEQVRGTCQNLSESGLLAACVQPLDIWTRGKVDLLFGAGLLGMDVRVARTQGLQVGCAFQNMDDQRRAKLRELMAAARKTGFLPDHL